MMRELEHVASKQGAGCHECLLGRRLDVTGQQQARVSYLHAHHQRTLVGALLRHMPRGPEWRHAEVSDPQWCAAGSDLLHGHGA